MKMDASEAVGLEEIGGMDLPACPSKDIVVAQ